MNQKRICVKYRQFGGCWWWLNWFKWWSEPRKRTLRLVPTWNICRSYLIEYHRRQRGIFFRLSKDVSHSDLDVSLSAVLTFHCCSFHGAWMEIIYNGVFDSLRLQVFKILFSACLNIDVERELAVNIPISYTLRRLHSHKRILLSWWVNQLFHGVRGERYIRSIYHLRDHKICCYY